MQSGSLGQRESTASITLLFREPATGSPSIEACNAACRSTTRQQAVAPPRGRHGVLFTTLGAQVTERAEGGDAEAERGEPQGGGDRREEEDRALGEAHRHAVRTRLLLVGCWLQLRPASAPQACQEGLTGKPAAAVARGLPPRGESRVRTCLLWLVPVADEH